jgi:hypothetical protein
MLAEGADVEQAVILGMLEKETGYATQKLCQGSTSLSGSRSCVSKGWTLPTQSA